MSRKSSYDDDDDAPVIEVVFAKDLDSSEESEEPPQEEWSSLILEIPEENIKRMKYFENLYDPGSGEICSKYIAASASSMLRHPYYNYPAVLDPGVKEALLHPFPKVEYPSDGQELYLTLCKEIGICPVRKFYRQLLENTINLKYYGINPVGIRAIAMSIKLNRIVKVLDLTDNWVNDDGCFHLGTMLVDNITLTELNLTGCRIGPEGAKRLFDNIHLNRSLKILNLSKNQLGDQGVEYLAKAVFKGADVANLNLSYNSLTPNCIASLAEALETNNKITNLDLSWNTILSSNALTLLCKQLSENLTFEELNLSWNSLSGQQVGNAFMMLLNNPKFRRLILTNNMLEGPAINAIGSGLSKAENLEILDLSYNPLTTIDAMYLLGCLKKRVVKLQKLIMENVLVSSQFLVAREKVLSLNFRKNTVITYGGVKVAYKPVGPDPREVTMRRAHAVCKQSKKKPVEFALIILELNRVDSQPMDHKMFCTALRNRGANLDDDLVMEILNQFPGPIIKKVKFLNMVALVDYIKRKWPDAKLPPLEEVVLP